jgi:amino acid adenylation domain-containing protein
MSTDGRPAYLAQHYGDLSYRSRPTACAIRCRRNGDLTYEELFVASNRLAHGLRAAGVRRQSRVAICLERGANSIVAMLAALKADAIYVPIHGKGPRERAARILADCAPDAIIVDERSVDPILAALDPAAPRPPFLLLGERGRARGLSNREWMHQAEIDAQPCDPMPYANIDTDLAYILYTSGSTGQPKGVMISHLNIVNYIDWAVGYFAMGPGERVLGTSPFHFDMSTFDVFATQKSGGTLCLASEEEALFPTLLLPWMEGEGVTLWKGVASLLAQMARAGAIRPGRLPDLKKVLFSGERLPTKALMTWMAAFPDKRFYNVYGPTEATGISSAFAVDSIPESADTNVPIGQACANTEMLILTDADRLAETDEQGEICIRGSSLSRGYWNDAERTRLAFIDNPLSHIPGDRLYRTGDLGFRGGDGNVRLVGRRDEQVKWMGYRIELGEIVTALQSLPEVEEGAVLLLPGRASGTDELVAFVNLAEGALPATILGELRRVLPPYMVPRKLVPVPFLPRSDSGKIDREALRRIAGSHD